MFAPPEPYLLSADEEYVRVDDGAVLRVIMHDAQFVYVDVLDAGGQVIDQELIPHEAFNTLVFEHLLTRRSPIPDMKFSDSGHEVPC